MVHIRFLLKQLKRYKYFSFWPHALSDRVSDRIERVRPSKVKGSYRPFDIFFRFAQKYSGQTATFYTEFFEFRNRSILLLIVSVFYCSMSCYAAGGNHNGLWGVQADGQVVYSAGHELSKKKASSPWRIISASPVITKVATGGQGHVWALGANNQVFCRQRVSAQYPTGSEWVEVPGSFLKDIAVSIEGQIWGIDVEGRPIVRRGVTDSNPPGTSWTVLDGSSCIKITTGADNTVWALDNEGRLWGCIGSSMRRPTGKGWKYFYTPEPLEHVAAGAGVVWALDKKSEVWIGTHAHHTLSSGLSWEKVDTKNLKEIAVSREGQVFGIDKHNNLFFRACITPTNRAGSWWKKIPEISLRAVAFSDHGPLVAGLGSFFYDARQAKSGPTRYHYAWRFARPDKGWVQFKSRSQADLFVTLSAKPKTVRDKTYSVIIGGYIPEKGEYSSSMIGIVGQKPHVVYEASYQEQPRAFIQKGATDYDLTWSDYWVFYDHGLIRCGKSPILGENEIMRYQDREPITAIKYVGLGGGHGGHEFKDIRMSGSPSFKGKVDLPSTFVQVGGRARRMSVGSNKGSLVVLAVGADYQLYRYDSSLLSNIPWIKINPQDYEGKVIVGFNDVSVASDGTVCALDLTGKSYRYSWKHDYWKPLGNHNKNDQTFTRITAGNKHCIWALDKKTRNCYRWNNGCWQEVATSGCIGVDAGLDGTVVAINAAHDAYIFDYQTGGWRDLVNRAELGRIAVGMRDHMWGTHHVGSLYYVWQLTSTGWRPLMTDKGRMSVGLKQISINAAGTLFALDDHGRIYRWGDRGVSDQVVCEALKSYSAKVSGDDKKSDDKV